jgi:hypothetical protein
MGRGRRASSPRSPAWGESGVEARDPTLPRTAAGSRRGCASGTTGRDRGDLVLRLVARKTPEGNAASENATDSHS